MEMLMNIHKIQKDSMKKLTKGIIHKVNRSRFTFIKRRFAFYKEDIYEFL